VKLGKKCNKWWWHLYCLFHQFFHCHEICLIIDYQETTNSTSTTSTILGYVKFINGTFINISKLYNIQPMKLGLMGERCIAWTSQWWWTIVGYSYIWTSSTQIHTMTLLFFTNWTSTKFGFICLATQMSISNIYWMTLDTWVKGCL
jgi:hypothetical protein